MAAKDIRNPLAGGGTFEYFRLASKLCKSGYEVSVLCGSYSGGRKKEVVDGIQVNRIGGSWSVYILSLFALLLDSNLRRHDKIVNVEENGIPFLAPYLLRIPSVIICWHLPRETFFVELMNQYGKLLGFFVATLLCFFEDYLSPKLFRSTTVFTFSQCSQTDLADVGFKDVRMYEFALAKGIMLLSNNLSKLPIDDQSNLEGAYGNPQLLVVGRLTKYKGVQDIIHALPRLIHEFPNLRLVIVGRGEYEPELIRLTKDLGLENYVIFAGYVSVSRKMELYRQSQLNLVPSYKEGFPTPLIEAALVAIPTMVPNRMGLREFVKNGQTGFVYNCDGFLSPRPDFEILTSKIGSILRNNSLRVHVGLAAQRFYNNTNIDSNETRFLQDFDRTLKGRIG